jgi:hypothetical protein
MVSDLLHLIKDKFFTQIITKNDKPDNKNEVLEQMQDFIGGSIDSTEICVIGDNLFKDISLSEKMNGMGIKIDNERTFDLLRYGFTLYNLKNILCEIPLNYFTKFQYGYDPYFIHDNRLIMKNAIIKDMPTSSKKPNDK